MSPADTGSGRAGRGGPLNTLIEKSRLLVLVAVLGSLVCMTGLLLLGVYEIVSAVQWALHEADESPTKLVVFVMEVIDTFLIATVCYLIALGLYQLFVDRDIAVPPWLSVKDFDDLKRRLTSVVIVILGVGFLAEFVEWDGKSDLLKLGGATALVIIALTFFLRESGSHGSGR